jgi:signal transduction histidine kinase
MSRAFVSLYLIIVLSIILLGLVLNKFWDELNPPDAVDSAVLDLINVIEKSIENNQNHEKTILLRSLTANLNYHVEIIPIVNFSNTNITAKIAQGSIVSVSDEKNHYFYKRLRNTNDVLMLTNPSEKDRQNILYISFIVLFYAAIAGVIFLWVWPMARDLTRLGLHTQQIGKDGQQATINISTRSVLYPFAKAFNTMAKRLNEILCSQKEMTLAVSHELRTPLARMKFALAMTEEQNTSVFLQRQLSNISEDISQMEALINSFLAYAGFDQHSQQLSQCEGHMHDLVQEIISRLRSHEGNEIIINVNDETRGQVMICEWSLMQTAIQNLMHNALGYAKSTILVNIKILPDHFLIEFEDDGSGVPEDQQTRIFESFVRIYSELTNRSGFGLGLALTKRIMEWHCGHVSCTRSPLGGAKFTLRWPTP